MEKAIRRPIALVLSMPCTKFGLLKIHTERDDAKKGIYLAFTYKNASVCTRTYRHVAQNYQLADKILPQTHALRLPLVVCGCTRALQIAFLCAQTATMADHP